MAPEATMTLRGVRVTLAPPDERRGGRRTIDERLRLLLPGLSRKLGAAVLGLPPRSRLRRAILARSMVRAYAAANRRDFELILLAYDPGAYQYHPSADLLPPDFERVYRGHDGYLHFWSRWLDAFEDIRWDPEEMLDLGERVLVTTRQSGHGSGSGVAVSLPVYQLFTLRHGMVVSQQDFLDRPQALEAAGRPE
jgi:hypothetical protein